MDVSLPMFMLGFKDLSNKEKLKAGMPENMNDTIKYDVAIQILLEMLIGDSSKLYEELYTKGLINKPLGGEFSSEEDYAFSAISGESKKYKKVITKIKDAISDMKKNGLVEEDFERTKKMLYGRFVRGFEDVSSIANMFISDFFRGVNASKYVEAYKEIDKSYVEEVLNKHFDFEKMAVSLVLPQ